MVLNKFKSIVNVILIYVGIIFFYKTYLLEVVKKEQFESYLSWRILSWFFTIEVCNLKNCDEEISHIWKWCKISGSLEGIIVKFLPKVLCPMGHVVSQPLAVSREEFILSPRNTCCLPLHHWSHDVRPLAWSQGLKLAEGKKWNYLRFNMY